MTQEPLSQKLNEPCPTRSHFLSADSDPAAPTSLGQVLRAASEGALKKAPVKEVLLSAEGHHA